MIKVWPYWTLRLKTLFLAAQFALLCVIVLFAILVGPETSLVGSLKASSGLILVLFACQGCFYATGLDELIVNADLRLFLTKTCTALGWGLILAGVLFYLFPHLSPGNGEAALVAFLSAALVSLLRPLVPLLMRGSEIVEQFLIVGTGELAARLYWELMEINKNLETKGLWSPSSLGSDRLWRSGRTVRYSELKDLILKDRISTIIVAEPDVEDREEFSAILLECKLHGVEIEEANQCYERLRHKVWLKGLRPEWFISSGGFRFSKFYHCVKRVFDVFCAVLVIILAAPLIVLIAVGIKLGSPGPILFGQERVGQGGKLFTLYKFRSMRQDAERDTGPVWAREGDGRVTGLGKILRKFHLDEIPQVLNVLRGELSFVGPRPERPCFVNLFRQSIPYYDLRHYIKPGITGWAQVSHGYASSIEDSYEKLQYDLYYIKHLSLRLDLTILLKTLKPELLSSGR
jgi:sugar transferase (PEP-CTERM system associated)